MADQDRNKITYFHHPCSLTSFSKKDHESPPISPPGSKPWNLGLDKKVYWNVKPNRLCGPRCPRISGKEYTTPHTWSRKPEIKQIRVKHWVRIGASCFLKAAEFPGSMPRRVSDLYSDLVLPLLPSKPLVKLPRLLLLSILKTGAETRTVLASSLLKQNVCHSRLKGGRVVWQRCFNLLCKQSGAG